MKTEMSLSQKLLTKPARISGLQMRNVIRKLGADGNLFTREDVWAYVVDNYGFIQYNSINPVIHDMSSGAWGNEGIVKTGRTANSVFGKKMALYQLTKFSR